MEKMLVSPSPQIRDNISTSKVMTHVLVALCPALAMSAYVFGGRALMLTGFCMITALIWERLCNLIMKRPDSTKDVSALVTGMLLAFNLPVTMPYWQAAIGTFVHIKIFFNSIVITSNSKFIYIFNMFLYKQLSFFFGQDIFRINIST